jgi:hypothetical protein
LETQKGREAYVLLKSGAIDGLSIGFVVREAFKHPSKKRREITQIDLFEVSIVTFGSNPQALITDVKGLRRTVEV